MPKVEQRAHAKGDYFVDYEEKVFEDVKAEPGQKALVTFHTVAFEGSIGFVNLLRRRSLRTFSASDVASFPGRLENAQPNPPTSSAQVCPSETRASGIVMRSRLLMLKLVRNAS